MSDRIAVCGANGFVGRKLTETLVKEGHDVVAIVRRPVVKTAGVTHPLDGAEICIADLWRRDDTEAALRGVGWIFNLAATVGGIGYIQERSAECLLSSLVNTNLLLAASKLHAKGYFFASSSCVYPGGEGLMQEDTVGPTTAYGHEKLFSERMCQAFSKDLGLPTSILRYHGIYGPGDHRGDPKKDHVIAAMCRKVARAKISGDHSIMIHGDGSQTRSFLYIDDCVEGTKKALFNGISGPLNLASPYLTSVNMVVDFLEEIAGIKLERFYSCVPTGVQNKGSDNRRLREVMAWEPPTMLKVGLEKTYRDFYDHELKQ